MENDIQLTKAKIAAREGLSRARVTQVMNLLDLPEDIQSGVLNPPAPLTMHAFSERRLRAVVSSTDPQIQAFQWRELIHRLSGA